MCFLYFFLKPFIVFAFNLILIITIIVVHPNPLTICSILVLEETHLGLFQKEIDWSHYFLIFLSLVFTLPLVQVIPSNSNFKMADIWWPFYSYLSWFWGIIYVLGLYFTVTEYLSLPTPPENFEIEVLWSTRLSCRN